MAVSIFMVVCAMVVLISATAIGFVLCSDNLGTKDLGLVAVLILFVFGIIMVVVGLNSMYKYATNSTENIVTEVSGSSEVSVLETNKQGTVTEHQVIQLQPKDYTNERTN